ncbi:MAG TPA: sulfatase-like hydrolase/transferase, partial [Arenibacter sp.]|nr:sulfatase-like hydrolase/transferase [Arenibacter sp.]
MSRILVFIPLLIILFSCGEKKEEPKPRTPPNVILIFTDDQGYQDLGTFGSPDIDTPHLDRMAEEGVKLTSYYAAQAVCSASRAGILTGCYPNRIGIHGAYMPNAGTGLNNSETTIAEMLRSIGYKTAIFGKWHLGDHEQFMPNNQGFDEYFGIPYSNDMWPLHPQQGPIFNFGPLPLYENKKVIDTLTDQSDLTTRITERSVGFIERNKENPFFLYVAHPQPHVPLFVSDKFKGKSKRGLYG